jgi:hypothetical protein
MANPLLFGAEGGCAQVTSEKAFGTFHLFAAKTFNRVFVRR